jgi:putative membrane protein
MTTGVRRVRGRGRGWRRPAAVALAAALVLPATARAHPGRALEPHDLWTAWSARPVVLVGLLLGSWWYLLGVRRVWGRAGRGRGVAPWRVACWLAGTLVVAIALLSPLDALGGALFAAHMVQHLLLMLVAAPLLALGEPLLPLLWAAPRGARRAAGAWWHRATVLRRGWRTATRPTVAWALHVATVLAWHAPRWYDAAERSEPLHVLEHATFFVTALLFWYVLTDRQARRRLGTGGAVLYLFAAAMASTLLGAAISLAPHPWYTSHYGTTRAWGLTPLEDQQLAGLIMWVPGGLVYLVALVPILVRVLRTRR